MGAVNTKDFCDIETPPRSAVPSRILTLDPRSPSACITRTPILVEQTPEGVHDPRSPTPGIIRTPIAPNILKGKQLDSQPLISDMEGSFTEYSEEVDSIDILPANFPALQNLQLNDRPDRESTRLLPNDMDLFKELSESERKRKVKAKVAKTTQPKQLFPSKRSGLFTKDNTRSPLATKNVDMNTPLSIVKQKQSKKVEVARSCTIEHVNSPFQQNKENIDL